MPKRKHKQNVDFEPKRWSNTSKAVWTFGLTLFVLIFCVAFYERFRRDSQSTTTEAKSIEKPTVKSDGDITETDISALKQRYFELGAKEANRKITLRIDNLRSRIEVCKAIIENASEQADYEFGKLGLLNDYGVLYTINMSNNLGLSDVDRGIDEAIKSNMQDKNEFVRNAAQRLAFQKQIVALGVTDQTDQIVDEAVKLVADIAKSHLDDVPFAYSFGSVVDLFKFRPEKVPATIKILNAMISAWSSSTNQEIQAWVGNLQDEVVLLEANYFERLAGVTVSDAESGDYLLERIPGLLEKGLHVGGINTLLSLAEQFEMNDWYGRASKIFSLVDAHLKNNNVARGDELKTKCEYGIKRLNLLNSPLKFKVKDVNGVEYSSENGGGSTTVVMFFDSVKDVKSLAPIQSRLKQMREQGLKCFVVVLQVESEGNLSLMANSTSGLIFVYDPKAESDFFLSCPVSAAPYFFMTDKTGRVVDLNISASRLISDIEELIFGPAE